MNPWLISCNKIGQCYDWKCVKYCPKIALFSDFPPNGCYQCANNCVKLRKCENFVMEDCLKMCYLQTCQISNQYNNVWEWLKLSAGHITLATAKKAPSHGNFSKILSEYGAHVQGLTAVKRTEIFFVWLKLYACHITLASQISQLLINIFKFCFMVALI